MDIDDFINQNIKELSKPIQRRIPPPYTKKVIELNDASEFKHRTIKGMVQQIQNMNPTNSQIHKKYYESIFGIEKNDNIQLECLTLFELDNIQESVEKLFIDSSIIINSAFCDDLIHNNLMKYITQYISFLIFDSPHFYLAFKNMKFIKEQIKEIKGNIIEQLKNETISSGDIVTIAINLNLNIDNIEQLNEKEQRSFTEKRKQQFELTFLIK